MPKQKGGEQDKQDYNLCSLSRRQRIKPVGQKINLRVEVEQITTICEVLPFHMETFLKYMCHLMLVLTLKQQYLLI